MLGRLIDQLREQLAVPVTTQSKGMCGPATLQAVLKYWGHDASEKEIARLSGATRWDGVTPDGLCKAARHFGCRTWMWDGADYRELERWVARGVPVIVDWWSVDAGHYSVVLGFGSNKNGKRGIKIMDPEYGANRIIDLPSFSRRWFGFDDQKKHDGVSHRLAILVLPDEAAQALRK